MNVCMAIQDKVHRVHVSLMCVGSYMPFVNIISALHYIIVVYRSTLHRVHY